MSIRSILVIVAILFVGMVLGARYPQYVAKVGLA